MAAYVNRTISLMSGDDPVVRGTSMGVGPMGDAQSLHDSSSLQIFIKAKKKINDIFVEIEEYVHDAVSYIQSKYQIKYFSNEPCLKGPESVRVLIL
jgi:mitofusin